jgi:hypothetical protein
MNTWKLAHLDCSGCFNYGSVLLSGYSVNFWIMPPCSLGTNIKDILKMEVVCSPKTCVPIYETTWSHKSENHNMKCSFVHWKYSVLQYGTVYGIYHINLLL